MRYILALLGLPLLAGTYTAGDCQRNTVNALINGPGEDATHHVAVDGDIIQIPAGSCTWTAGITIPVGAEITITGSGTPANDAATIGASAACAATVLTDNITSPSGAMFLLQPTYSGAAIRVSCMKIMGQASLGANSLYSPIAAQGTCNGTTCGQIRVDNITFDGSLQYKIANSGTVIVTDNVFGVLDHNSMSGSPTGQGIEFVNFNHSAWNGVGAYGDNSWTSASTFGTSQTLYVENNAFGAGVVVGETESAVPNGGAGGGRVAMRFNVCNGCYHMVSTHGTETNGRPRGGRQIEMYGNTLHCTNSGGGCQAGAPVRSGVVYAFGNSFTVTNAWWNAYVSFSNYRTWFDEFPPWGGCNGTGPYDANEATVYDSGTYTGTTGSADFVDGSKNWGTNVWQPNGAAYSIINTTRGWGEQIATNTATTITPVRQAGCAWGGANCTWTNGDSYQIRRATACLDQPNRSGGSLLSGSPTPTPNNSSGGWQNQTIDPSYEWNDSGVTPGYGNARSDSDASMVANRDWYTDDSNGTPHPQTSSTSPFNGASGVGLGIAARRPTTCTTGVAYWATDEGEWNSANAGADGRLYKCTATNIWTLSYTPYAYPHPLITGGGGPPVTPTGTNRRGSNRGGARR